MVNNGEAVQISDVWRVHMNIETFGLRTVMKTIS